jgi:hypothetical protein
MKKTVIYSISALTLFSCGGNQSQQPQIRYHAATLP